MAQEAISQLHAEAAELHADAAAQRILAGPQVDVLEKASGVRLQVKPLDSGIGVLAQTPDGRLHFDNRLETRLARLRTSIRSEVYRVLIGESK